MKKLILIPVLSSLLVATMTSCNTKKDPWKDVVIEKGINLYQLEYEKGVDKFIDVYVEGYQSGTSLGIYERDSEPGSAKGAIRRKPIKDDINIYSFELSDLKHTGEYNLFLMDKNLDIVFDFEMIKILEEDFNDYKVDSATLSVDCSNNFLSSSLEINTQHTKELTYEIYWANENTRLADYTAIEIVKSKDKNSISVPFNDGMVAPNEATQIEITVKEGRTSSFFIPLNDALKVSDSIYKNTIQVGSDVHIESKYTCKNYNSHLISNLNAIKNYEHETSGIVLAGDVANTGNKNNYDLFYDYIDSVFDIRPTLYPIVGNHELQYFDDYQEAINTYKENTGMPGAYFSFELAGIKCFALGSEDTTTHGYMSNSQLEWFTNEMSKLDKNEKVMIFMHQGIYNTVSGTLPEHGWHGLGTKTNGLRDIVKQYPNAFVFSGHSHQDINCKQTSLFGQGDDANYINCGSMAYVLDDNRNEVYGSSFYFIDIYEDYLILKGRMAIENKWVSAAQFVVPFIK